MHFHFRPFFFCLTHYHILPFFPQVDGTWRYGRVAVRHERRWFDSIIYIVDTLAGRCLISYLGEYTELNVQVDEPSSSSSLARTGEKAGGLQHNHHYV